MEVRQPKIGYNSEEKQSYRKEVWDALLSMPRSKDGKILILPSSGGEEIDYIISRGVKQSEIICIDENPAVIASAAWRKKYKSIRVYGCKVSSVAGRLIKDGFTLDIANLDLCNNFSEELVTEVMSFLRDAPLCENDFSFSVTVSKGREQSVTNYLMNILMTESSWKKSDFTKMKEKRIACLMRICFEVIPKSKILRLLKEGSYTHHKTPMAFAVFSINDQIKSALCQGVFEKVNFERLLYKRCFIEKIAITLKSANRYYRNVINNSNSIAEISDSNEEIKNTCNDICTGNYDKCASAARLIIEEHNSIENDVMSFLDGAIDCEYRGAGTMHYWLHLNGLSFHQITDIEHSLNLYDCIKSKAP